MQVTRKINTGSIQYFILWNILFIREDLALFGEIWQYSANLPARRYGYKGDWISLNKKTTWTISEKEIYFFARWINNNIYAYWNLPVLTRPFFLCNVTLSCFYWCSIFIFCGALLFAQCTQWNLLAGNIAVIVGEAV